MNRVYQGRHDHRSELVREAVASLLSMIEDGDVDKLMTMIAAALPVLEAARKHGPSVVTTVRMPAPLLKKLNRLASQYKIPPRFLVRVAVAVHLVSMPEARSVVEMLVAGGEENVRGRRRVRIG